MANKMLFQTIFGGLIPATDAINFEGAPAYALSPKHALAQYAATGCFNLAVLQYWRRETLRDWERNASLEIVLPEMKDYDHRFK